MPDINSFGTIAVISIVVLIAIFSIILYILNGKGSLRDSEGIYRSLVLVGGILIGLGIGGQHDNPIMGIGDPNEILLGVLLTVAGILLVNFGSTYLNNALWQPLEEISEYSAEFGKNFIATRLPIAGDVELRRFAERFNENAETLANKISILEIELDKLTSSVNKTINNGIELANETKSVSDLTINYNSVTNRQQNVINDIGDNISEFVEWYTSTQERLRENFIELRSLSEMGNLIAVNAAVEASNLEEPHPGFETLAAKLRDLARSLEGRQESLRRLLDEVNIRYDEFKRKIESNVSDAIKLSDNTQNISERVDKVITDVSEKETIFMNNTNELRRNIDNFEEFIPTAYLD